MKRPIFASKPLAGGKLPFSLGPVRTHTLGACPACGCEVQADGHAIRLHGDFFHVACALYRRDRAA